MKLSNDAMPDSNVGILLVEDHNVVRTGIASLFARQTGYHIEGEASDAGIARQLIRQGLNPDIIITDLHLPDINGIDLIAGLKNSLPSAKFIVLSMVGGERPVTDAFRAGANGYLLKSVSPEELIFAVRHIYDGGIYLSSEIVEKYVRKLISSRPSAFNEDKQLVKLDKRDKMLLELIADGCTNHEIADRLALTQRTVESIRNGLLNKTGTRNTAALIKYVVARGMISS